MNRRHRFSAYLPGEGPRACSHVAGADSFIDAAVLFAETIDASDGEICVAVRDSETGIERCFAIDIATGAVASH